MVGVDRKRRYKTESSFLESIRESLNLLQYDMCLMKYSLESLHAKQNVTSCMGNVALLPPPPPPFDEVAVSGAQHGMNSYGEFYSLDL